MRAEIQIYLKLSSIASFISHSRSSFDFSIQKAPLKTLSFDLTLTYSSPHLHIIRIPAISFRRKNPFCFSKQKSTIREKMKVEDYKNLPERIFCSSWVSLWKPSEELRAQFPPRHSDFRDRSPPDLPSVFAAHQDLIRDGRWTFGLWDCWCPRAKMVKHATHVRPSKKPFQKKLNVVFFYKR